VFISVLKSAKKEKEEKFIFIIQVLFLDQFFPFPHPLSPKNNKKYLIFNSPSLPSPSFPHKKQQKNILKVN